MMSFFTSGAFWFFEGILACLVVIGFKIWMEDRKVTMTYWKWMLFGLWLGLAGVTLAFIGTNLGENEPNAAIKGGLMLGFFTVMLGVIFWRLIHAEKGLGVAFLPFLKHKKASKEHPASRLGTTST